MGSTGSSKVWWQTIWCSVVFCIWKKRNAVIFNQQDIDSRSLIDDITFVSWSWLKQFDSAFRFSLVQWMSNTSACLNGPTSA
ncbi:hypothetical protein JHK85_006901 [Glycine max]|nr:hypothetical protein JHK85_006901 [Glycine max]KAG5071492.1 hypothetical protein JHK86_006703 [Glycine max]